MSQQQTAFPYNRPSLSASGKWETIAEPGMDLRDWFAGMALQGLLSAEPCLPSHTGTYGNVADNYAHEAYTMADAMMKERIKK